MWLILFLGSMNVLCTAWYTLRATRGEILRCSIACHQKDWQLYSDHTWTSTHVQAVSADSRRAGKTNVTSSIFLTSTPQVLPGKMHSPPKQSPKSKGWSEVLSIMEAVDYTESIWYWHPQALAELIQILFFCTRPGRQMHGLEKQHCIPIPYRDAEGLAGAS